VSQSQNSTRPSKPLPRPKRIFTNNRATTIWGPDKVQGVRLRDETVIDCDLVVVAAGIRPNTDVATTSGFTVEQAIVVDDQMRTVDDDHVFAVGECVQHRGEVYGLVAPLWEQAVVLADDHRQQPAGGVPRFPHSHQAQGCGCRGGRDGVDRTGARHR
jgi:NAD(P)H-nitrite reductase large subunit